MLGPTRIAPLLCALACTAPAPKGPLTLGALVARPLAPGAEVLEGSLLRGDEPAGRLLGVRFTPGALTAEILLNGEPRALAELAPRAAVVVNGGFFTPERRPTGLLISRRKTLAAFVSQGGPAGSGVFLLRGDKAELWTREETATAGVPPAELAIQAGPRLVERGGGDGILRDDGVRANRTVIGADGRGRVLLLTFAGPEGFGSGPTLYETMRLLGSAGLGRRAKEEAATFALNLDGGPSTGIHVRAQPPLSQPEAAPVVSVVTLSGAAPEPARP